MPMDSDILDYSPETGVLEKFHFDDTFDGGRIIHEVEQDVTDIVEECKAHMANTDERARYGEMTRVASIPMSIFQQMLASGMINDQQAMKDWLNNPDNRVFRTRPGRV